MGTSVPSTVADDDLDRHVAELILKEAKQKAERYAQVGYRAYLPEPYVGSIHYLVILISISYVGTIVKVMRLGRINDFYLR
jgi:hypothetical protein